jgi:hypothetical protein
VIFCKPHSCLRVTRWSRIFTISATTDRFAKELKNGHFGIKRIVIRVAEIHIPYFLWFGYVLFVIESNDIKISFLHPCGPSASDVYPAMPDILWLPQFAVLTDVSRNT